MAKQHGEDNRLVWAALEARRDGVVTGESWSVIRKKLSLNISVASVRKSINHFVGLGQCFWTASVKTLGGREYTIILVRFVREKTDEPKPEQKPGVDVGAPPATGGRKRRRKR